MGKKKIDRNDLKEYLESHTVSEAAGHFGTNVSYLYKIINENGFEYIRKKARISVDGSQFVDFVKSHTSGESMEHFHLKYGTFKARCKRFSAKALRKRKCPFIYQKEFWEQNKSVKVKEIAEKYNLSVTTVFFARKKFENEICFKKFRRLNRQNATRDEMIAYLAKKYSLSSIAEIFGISRERARQVVNEAEGCSDSRIVIT